VEETAAALDRRRRAEGAWQRIEDRPAAAVFMPLDLPAPAANGGGDSGANRAADPRAGWTLAGYGADPAALLSGDPTPLWLFWAAPDVSAAPAVPATLAAAGWRRIDATLWMQHVPAAINLVANGSFEGEAGASGFPQDYYAASPPADPAAGFSGRSVEAVVRGGRETQAAVLSSGPANPSTSFVSPPIAVTPGRLYLQAGALRGAGGRGYLGRNWLLAGGGVQEEYLFAGEENGAWQQGAVLAAAPPDAAAVQVLLLNRNATGRVCFDDILLLGLDLAAD